MHSRKYYSYLFKKKLTKKINKKISHFSLQKEYQLFGVFAFLIGILIIRIFYLQIVEGEYYKNIFYNQHYQVSSLKAKRGNIFVYDKSGKPIQLTDNIDVYNVFVDPKFVTNKKDLLPYLSDLLYQHFCEQYGLIKPTRIQCINNVENFSKQTILPELLYESFTGAVSPTISGEIVIDSGLNAKALEEGYFLRQQKRNEEREQKVSQTTKDQLTMLIGQRLEEIIQPGIKNKNYLGFFNSEGLLNEIKNANLPFMSIEGHNYLYTIPSKAGNLDNAISALSTIFQKHGYFFERAKIKEILEPQEIRYIKIINEMNANLAKKLQDWKIEHANNITEKIPLFHGVGLEKYGKRYYPYEQFMSHILGFVDKQGEAFYGIEKYFNDYLKGKDGAIKGLAVPRIGEIGSNTVDIAKPENGYDIYTTIDPMTQKELEKIIQQSYYEFRADSISALVMDPFSGKIKAMANFPSFDPNKYDDIYKIQPLSVAERSLIEDITYIDIPVYISTGGTLKVATLAERFDPNIEKFINKTPLGPQVFVDKNIGLPYEPGSVFKAFTVGIGLDSDEISLYDFYNDEGKVTVGEYTISNVAKDCLGTHTFLNALIFSCNVGMVRISQRFGKYVFYNYLEKLKFGKTSGIELAGEEAGFLETAQTTSLARYFNNAFGQGLLVTPLQTAVGYAALVNGGYYVKPTIIDKIVQTDSNTEISYSKKTQEKIFKTETSETMKEALHKVMYEGSIKKFAIPGYSLGGKSGTSQLSFKGKYQKSIGRTNGSFVGMITQNNTKYVVVIQVRRPRNNQRGEATAGKVFGEIAKFLLDYDLIQD